MFGLDEHKMTYFGCRLKIKRENPLRKSGGKEVHSDWGHRHTRNHKDPGKTTTNRIKTQETNA